MSHFAKVIDGIVTKVIVAEQDHIDNVESGEWIQTSYNTHGGKHLKGGTPLRKNFAGVGFHYDKSKDAFYAPQPYASWTLNSTSFLWEAPEAYPSDGKIYKWDEDSKKWVEG
tara:strand:+ start:25 stop:360 length:336 start_codon:yes stop_codon:yes gene_type:complete